MKKIEYAIIAHKNPLRPEDNAMFYAQMKSKFETTLSEICDAIGKRCTVTRPDILAVVAALEETAIEGLQSGQIIRLGDLGSFHLTLKSKGTSTEKEFNSTYIKTPRIRFTPGKSLKKAMKTVEFTTAHICKEEEEKTEQQG